MVYLRQLLCIFVVSFLGEFIKYILPFPIPASIYGMLIMFTCLMTDIIKLDQVKDTGKFLIEIMPVMFIPAGVGLMTSWGVMKELLVPISLIVVIAYLTVMFATGRISQIIIRQSGGSEHE